MIDGPLAMCWMDIQLSENYIIQKKKKMWLSLLASQPDNSISEK